MTLHFMPELWLQEFGLEITETIRITESGPAEPLANASPGLFVKA
jgi:ectoine hydrolase